MAEAKKAIVVVPVILEVAEVELEIAIRVGIHVRNPVVAVVVPKRYVHHTVRISTESSYLPPSEFYAEPVFKYACSIV